MGIVSIFITFVTFIIIIIIKSQFFTADLQEVCISYRRNVKDHDGIYLIFLIPLVQDNMPDLSQNIFQLS